MERKGYRVNCQLTAYVNGASPALSITLTDASAYYWDESLIYFAQAFQMLCPPLVPRPAKSELN